MECTRVATLYPKSSLAWPHLYPADLWSLGRIVLFHRAFPTWIFSSNKLKTERTECPGEKDPTVNLLPFSNTSSPFLMSVWPLVLSSFFLGKSHCLEIPVEVNQMFWIDIIIQVQGQIWHLLWAMFLEKWKQKMRDWGMSGLMSE